MFSSVRVISLLTAPNFVVPETVAPLISISPSIIKFFFIPTPPLKTTDAVSAVEAPCVLEKKKL